jgi:phosphoenolpyruvate carboxykinase (ATP)
LGSEPQPVFSTCFGSPFLPLDPSVYGNMLRELIAEHSVDCWLVNTGWTGGKYGIGHRMPIRVTRTLLTAALDGSLRNVEFRTDKYFGFAVPTALPGVPTEILNPVDTWKDKDEFDKTARALVGMFQKNFAKFEGKVDADVRAAAPEAKLAAAVGPPFLVPPNDRGSLDSPKPAAQAYALKYVIWLVVASRRPEGDHNSPDWSP